MKLKAVYAEFNEWFLRKVCLCFSSNDMYICYKLQIIELNSNCLDFKFKQILYHRNFLKVLIIISIFLRPVRTVKPLFEIIVIPLCRNSFQCRDRQWTNAFKDKRKKLEMFKSRVPRKVSYSCLVWQRLSTCMSIAAGL